MSKNLIRKRRGHKRLGGEKEILTLAEAAELLQVSTETLYVLVRAGKIKGSKIGNQWRFLKTRLIKQVMK